MINSYSFKDVSKRLSQYMKNCNVNEVDEANKLPLTLNVPHGTYFAWN